MSILSKIRSWIAKIRSWIDYKVVGNLGANRYKKVFVADDDENSSLAVSKLSIEVGLKRFWWLFPIITVRKFGAFSFLDLLAAPLRTACHIMEEEVGNMPESASKLSESALDKAGERRVDRLKVRLTDHTEKATSRFNADHLQSVIRADRNKFREGLLEELGKHASMTFAGIAKKHLAELVMRVRQEIATDDVTEVKPGKTVPLALPTGTRFFVQKGKMTVFVIEQAPQKRTIKVMDEAGTRSDTYELSFPYVIFFVVMRGRKSDGMYVFFRKEPLRDAGDSLLRPGLPNIFEDYSVCFSASATKDSLAVMAEESLGSFWGGRFLATDAASNMEAQIGLDRWAERSRTDSFFGMMHQWKSASLTVNAMLAKISSDFAHESMRRARTASKILPVLDEVVDKMGASIANETKEACFKMVGQWQIPETVLTKLRAEYEMFVSETVSALKGAYGTEIESMCSEGFIRRALQGAATKALKELQEAEQKSIDGARQTLSVLLTEERS